MPAKEARLPGVNVRGHVKGPARLVDRCQSPVQCFLYIAEPVPATLVSIAIKAGAARYSPELSYYYTGMSRSVVRVARHLRRLRQAPSYQLALCGIAANNNSIHNILSLNLPYIVYKKYMSSGL